jgi:hypothetical protein
MVKRDFIYVGRRQGVKHPAVDALIWLNPDGSKIEECYYKRTRGRNWRVGGIYEGAEMEGDKAAKLDTAIFKDLWPDLQERVQWEAKTHEIDKRVKAARIEKQYRADVETALVEVRWWYQRLARTDYVSALSLKHLAIDLITKPLSSAEEKALRFPDKFREARK